MALFRHDYNAVLQGYVESDDLYLASPFAGVLAELPVTRGQAVLKDELVFRLTPNPEDILIREVSSVLNQSIYVLQDLKKPQRKQEQEVKLAIIEQVKARLLLAKLRMKRFKKLYELKAGNLDEADAAKQRFKELLELKKQREKEYELSLLGARDGTIMAQIQKIDSIRAREALFHWQLSRKTIYAPATGTIVDTYYSVGEWVPAGKPVASLLILEKVHIAFFVSAAKLKNIKLGQEIYVKCPGCTRSEKAKVTYISPEAEYAPPLVYSRENYDKIVFRIEAIPVKKNIFKPGQPVTVSGF